MDRLSGFLLQSVEFCSSGLGGLVGDDVVFDILLEDLDQVRAEV